MTEWKSGTVLTDEQGTLGFVLMVRPDRFEPDNDHALVAFAGDRMAIWHAVEDLAPHVLVVDVPHRHSIDMCEECFDTYMEGHHEGERQELSRQEYA